MSFKEYNEIILDVLIIRLKTNTIADLIIVIAKDGKDKKDRSCKK
jgi:hypothetical protein